MVTVVCGGCVWRTSQYGPPCSCPCKEASHIPKGQKGARAMLFVALAFLGLVPIRLAILVVAAVLHPDTYQ